MLSAIQPLSPNENGGGGGKTSDIDAEGVFDHTVAPTGEGVPTCFSC